MKIIFFLLICFSLEQMNNMNVQYNKKSPISKGTGVENFEFYLYRRFDEDNIKLYIEISYINNNICQPFPTLKYIGFENDEMRNFGPIGGIPANLETGPEIKSGQCFYKYSINLNDDDIDVIAFDFSLVDKGINDIYVKIYEEKSYLWIILLCVGLGVVLIAVGIGVFCYFYKKRKNKSEINAPLSPEVEPVFKPSIENSQN